MTMTVSTRIKGKSAALAAGQRRHDLRLGRIPKYVSIGKIKDNSVILKTPLESRIRRECEELRELNPHERDMKSDAAIVTVGIITFGKKAQPIIRALSVEEQDAIYLDIAERIAKKGDTKLLGLVVHRDESAPHAHYTLRGVNNKGFPMSEVFKAKETAELQDLVGQVLADHGHGEIKRGKPKKDRMRDNEPTANWVNRSVRQLHDDLPAELDAAQARLNEIYDRQDDADSLLKEKMDKVRYYEALAEKAKAQAELENANLEKLKKRVSTYENRVSKLLEDIAKLENSDSKEVREALESTGVVSKREVIFAGSENEEPEPIFQVNHDNDLDWD